MNAPHYTSEYIPLLTVLLKAAPFFKPEYAETAAAAVAWLLIHWPA